MKLQWLGIEEDQFGWKITTWQIRGEGYINVDSTQSSIYILLFQIIVEYTRFWPLLSKIYNKKNGKIYKKTYVPQFPLRSEYPVWKQDKISCFFYHTIYSCTKATPNEKAYSLKQPRNIILSIFVISEMAGSLPSS